MPTIYLDADACPVKEQVYRVAARYEMPLIVVANSSLRIPEMAGLHARMMVVPGAMDAADDWIAGEAQPGDDGSEHCGDRKCDDQRHIDPCDDPLTSTV